MSNVRESKTELSKAILTALLLAPGASLAQLEEVVVTAQKREQSSNDVGITLNAFTTDQLLSFGINRPDDLETLVPGLTVTNQQPAGAPVYTIRGVGFNDFTTSAASTVGIYNDTTNIPYPIMTRGVLFDIARVEVLKGPQGDLYGRNTTAGTINFISNRPTEEFEGGLRMGYDNFQALDIEGFVSGAMSDNVRGRLAIKSVNSSEGWQESVSRPGDELGERDELGLRGILDVDFSDTLSLSLTARYFRDQSDNLAATATAVAPGFDATSLPQRFTAEAADWTADHRPVNDNTTLGFSANLTWDIGDLTLTSITSYDDFERDAARFDTAGVNYEDADITNSTDISVFSQELRLESSARENLYWSTGLYYNDDDIEENYQMEFRDSFGLTGESRYNQTTESLAVFGHLEYDLNERSRLTLGARYTDEDREWSGCTFDTGDGLLAGFYNFFVYPVFLEPIFPGADPIPNGGCTVFNDLVGTPNVGQFTPFTDAINVSQLMGKVSFDYRPTEDILLFGTVSTAFKSGGFNGAIALSHTMLQPYQKEELTAFEVGVKSTLLDGSMQLNASAFLYDYEDKQELTTFIAPVGGVVGFDNVPESTVTGLEVEMSWQITEGLRWDLGLALLDTEIDEWQARCPAGLLGAPVDLPDGCPMESVFGNVLFFDASGDSLNNAPEVQATSTLSYSWSASPALDVTVAADISYKDDNIGSLAAPDPAARNLQFSGFIPDYTLLNARVMFRPSNGPWDLMLWTRNLTDEYYWHSTSGSNSTATRINGMPRTYGLTLSYGF